MGRSSPTALVHRRRGAVGRVELRAQQLVEHAGQRVRLGIKSANTQASACAGGGTTARHGDLSGSGPPLECVELPSNGEMVLSEPTFSMRACRARVGHLVRRHPSRGMHLARQQMQHEGITPQQHAAAPGRPRVVGCRRLWRAAGSSPRGGGLAPRGPASPPNSVESLRAARRGPSCGTAKAGMWPCCRTGARSWRARGRAGG